MTDNEIMDAFVKGCNLIKDDNVDREIITNIVRCLERCAKSMMPYITQAEGKGCVDCKHFDKYWNSCTLKEKKEKNVLVLLKDIIL